MDPTTFTIVDETVSPRFTVRSLLGVHGVAAAMCQLVSQSPGVAGLLAAGCGLVLLQAGLLAACTSRLTPIDG